MTNVIFHAGVRKNTPQMIDWLFEMIRIFKKIMINQSNI
ncbi:hypothetical protein THOD04_70011 [Vibrio owensii]|nr:hypothetical protein THOD04_70011 [Vibrio owensii]